MEIIKQYGYPMVLKDYYLYSTDDEGFRKLGLKLDTIEKICNHLGPDNKVRVNECYDSQSGWRGFHFIMDGVDLSGNGYCLSDKRILEHLSKFETSC